MPETPFVKQFKRTRRSRRLILGTASTNYYLSLSFYSSEDPLCIHLPCSGIYSVFSFITCENEGDTEGHTDLPNSFIESFLQAE